MRRNTAALRNALLLLACIVVFLLAALMLARIMGG